MVLDVNKSGFAVAGSDSLQQSAKGVSTLLPGRAGGKAR